MKQNMGVVDRIIRVIVAIAIGVLYFTDTISGGWALVLGIIAIVFLLTSFVTICPLYVLLGVNTCKRKQKR